MPIPVSCPACATQLNAPDGTAGRQVKCPRCGTTFVVAHDETPTAAYADPAPRYEAPPYDDYDDRGGYDDYDPGYRRRRRARRHDSEGDGAGLPLGLGVAGLSIGGAGLVIGMMPCIGFLPGMVAGAVGLVLSVVGLVVAYTQGNRAIAFPIAGAATSAMAILITLLVYYWVYREYRRPFWFGQARPPAVAGPPRAGLG